MKKTLKLIPALAMLLISAILVSTSTYAWFSMNNQVTVTGMTIRTEVNNNLLIAEASNGDGTNTGANKGTLNAPIAAMPEDSKYGTHLVKNVEALLEPVSSTTGLYDSFWYTSTTNVVSSGDAKTDSYTAYNAANTTDFNTNYNTTGKAFDRTTTTGGVGAVGYVDYVFALQATNTAASGSADVNMTKCDLTYQGTANAGKAFRVAVLVQECTSSSAAKTDTVDTKAILGTSNAAYFTVVSNKNQAVNGAAPTGNPAVAPFGDVTNYNPTSGVVIGSVDAGKTEYFKVTVRLWLEGEDTTCNNTTYAVLTNDYDLDLKFELNAGTAVSALTQSTAAVDAWTVASSATSSTSVTLSGITYYAYTATTGGTSTTIYGDNGTIGSVAHWFNISGTEVYEITEFVTKN